MANPAFDTWRLMLRLRQENPNKQAYHAALASAGVDTHEERPIPGYYRLRRGDGVLAPVFISPELVVDWGGEQARIEKVWNRCAGEPVPFAWVTQWDQTKEWPDDHSLAQTEQSQNVAGPGHNSGATESEIDKLRREIGIHKEGVKKYAIITTDDGGKAAQTLRSKLLEFSRGAKKSLDALLLPHQQEIAKLKKDWDPLISDAKTGADSIRMSLEAYETKKARAAAEKARIAEHERQRIAVEERQRTAALEAEAERQANEAQEAVDRGETPPDPAPSLALQAPSTVPDQPAEPARVAPVTTIKGGSGRAAHVKTKEVITDVTDWRSLFLFFVEDDEARTYIRKRAQSVLDRTGEIPPGVKTDIAAKVA